MPGDGEWIQIVDAAMAEAVRRAGSWLACRPGCAHCCFGPFAITRLDAQRLRVGLAALRTKDPVRAERVRERARMSAGRLPAPGDDEPCPALDPATGLCDVYESRPVTCRIFGPAVRGGDGAIGICELCFQGADDIEIAACAVDIDFEALETGGETTVAAALTLP